MIKITKRLLRLSKLVGQITIEEFSVINVSSAELAGLINIKRNIDFYYNELLKRTEAELEKNDPKNDYEGIMASGALHSFPGTYMQQVPCTPVLKPVDNLQKYFEQCALLEKTKKG